MISLNNLAWLTTLKRQRSMALDLINRAIARRGPLPELLDFCGVIYNGLATRHAIEDLERLQPRPRSSISSGTGYLQANNKDAALQALAKARS
jgi:hypothetical protein